LDSYSATTELPRKELNHPATNLAQLKYDCSQNNQLVFVVFLTYSFNLSFASFSQAFALFSSSFATTKDWKIKLFSYPVGNTARTS